METFRFVLIVLFFAVSVFKVTWVVMEETDDNKDTNWVLKLLFFITTSVLCATSILYESLKLKDSDVFNGRAEYVEIIHISKGDTIKTYHIQPKK